MDASESIMTTLGNTVFVKEMAIGDGTVMDDDGKDMGVVTNIVLVDVKDKRTIISIECHNFIHFVEMVTGHLFDSLTLEGRKTLGGKLLIMASTKVLEAALKVASDDRPE